MAPEITDISEEAALILKIEEVRRDRGEAADDDSHTAVATYHKLEAQLLERLAEVRAESARTLGAGGAGSDDDLVAVVVEAIPQIPDSAFERLAEAVDQRRDGASSEAEEP